MDKDFTPTKETVSLHGLGFIQVVLPGNQRLHVWHPELPRRACYEHSSIHNHRFGFVSRVLKGTLVNVHIEIELARYGSHGSHVIISHNGPRSPRGGRESFPVAHCNVYESSREEYQPGQQYSIPMGAYHYTPNSGIVVTLMTKLNEGRIHANSICRRGVEFDQDFDRFQLSPERLMDFVVEALR